MRTIRRNPWARRGWGKKGPYKPDDTLRIVYYFDEVVRVARVEWITSLTNGGFLLRWETTNQLGFIAVDDQGKDMFGACMLEKVE